MKLIRVSYKIIVLAVLAVIAVIVIFAYSLGSNQSSPNAKQIAYRKKWLQHVVKVIGIHVTVQGDIANDTVIEKQASLWVSNHISWMDIAVIGSQGVGFLSKQEVRKWPLIGWLGDKVGTVFINRGGKNAAQEAAKAIAEKIIGGDSILVFPEGTTGYGDNVMRFHARIFAPALDHQLRVQPIVLQYFDGEGRRHAKSVWKGESFLRNLVDVLGQSDMHALVTFLPALAASEFSERRQLAQIIEHQIRSVILQSQKNS